MQKSKPPMKSPMICRLCGRTKIWNTATNRPYCRCGKSDGKQIASKNR